MKYRVTFGVAVCEAKLWYDPKTHKPLKRVLNARSPSGESTMTEIYSEWLLDGDIPEEKFQLSER